MIDGKNLFSPEDKVPAPGSRVRIIAAARTGKVDIQFIERNGPRTKAPAWDAPSEQKERITESHDEEPLEPLPTMPELPHDATHLEKIVAGCVLKYRHLSSASNNFFDEHLYGTEGKLLCLTVPLIILIIGLIFVTLNWGH